MTPPNPLMAINKPRKHEKGRQRPSEGSPAAHASTYNATEAILSREVVRKGEGLSVRNGVIALILIVLIGAIAWSNLRDETKPEVISMHGTVVISAKSDYRLTGEKTYTGIDRCTGAGTRSTLDGKQVVTVKPSLGDAVDIALEPGFVNDAGGCEMWFIGTVPRDNLYRITAPTFAEQVFATTDIKVVGRMGDDYLAPHITD